ncbi:MAG: beta-propeller fold lactonase family protein [Acidobacteria bacterium]|nr:beta-propeller fold lactonase family protein [Acidobacteriota bacterium]
MSIIFLQLLWVALSAMATVAGATLVSPALADTFVYVGNAESNDIYVLQLNRQTGELALIETVPLPGITRSGGSTPMAVSPDRRFLYVATRGEPQSVFSFAIDAKSGRLKYAGSGPLVDSMPFIATDRMGRFLFAASYPGHKITVSPIGPNGAIQQAQQVMSNHTNAHAILPDAKNRYVLATTLGNDLINVFKFDAKTGKLEPNTPPSISLKAKSGPRHLIFHPNGKLVYVLGELDGAVHVFDYDSGKGQLKAKQSINALPPSVTGRIASADLHITPDGRFLYTSDRTSNTLTGFKVNSADGTLTLIETIPTEAMPRSFSIDSSGRYMFVVGMNSHRMSSYRIEPGTGKLTKLGEYAMGKIPNWVEIVDLPAK